MRPELIVAEKEFRDHLASKRFLAIFGIFLLLSFYGVYSGMDSYNNELDQYKNPQLIAEQSGTQDQIAKLQKQIQEADSKGYTDLSQTLKAQLKGLTSPSMPSILMVFNSMNIFLTYLGMILGAMMGFDQLSREKEEGSLKFLTISPLYRDAIINGKTIGAVATLAVALAATFLLAVAIVMFRGVVPGLDDVARIATYYVAALLYCTIFFAIAMMMSTLTKNTSIAVICTIGLVVVLVIYSIVAPFIGVFIAQSIVGPAPPVDYNSMMNSSNASAMADNPEYMNYYIKLMVTDFQVSDTLTIISPVNDFGGMWGIGAGGIGSAILSRTPVDMSAIFTASDRELSLPDSLLSVWVKILILIVELVVAFAISYVAFMRMDIR